MTTTALQPMLSCNEYGALIGLHPVTVRLKCANGEIPAVKVGRNQRWRIPYDYAESVVRAHHPTPIQSSEFMVAFLRELTNAGPLTDAQKDVIRQAFEVDTVDAPLDRETG